MKEKKKNRKQNPDLQMELMQREIDGLRIDVERLENRLRNYAYELMDFRQRMARELNIAEYKVLDI